MGRAQNSDLQNHFFKLLGSTILHYFSFHPSRGKKERCIFIEGALRSGGAGKIKANFTVLSCFQYKTALVILKIEFCLLMIDWLVGGGDLIIRSCGLGLRLSVDGGVVRRRQRRVVGSDRTGSTLH